MQNEGGDIQEAIHDVQECQAAMDDAIQHGRMTPETYQQETRWLNDQLGRLRARKEELIHTHA